MTPSERGDALEGQVVDERYRLKRRIGVGGMSLVYLAERLNIGKPVAVKFLRSAFANLPGFVRRFEQEARACSRLNHLNCVSVMDFGVAFGSPYLVMEYVAGTTVTELIARGPVPPRRAMHLCRQILAGLGHAHARGVVHRDLKPGNIMLTELTGSGEVVKIMDFGTAQILTGEPAEPTGGTEIGTPWYMAPEQAAGQPTDPRTDLYAVGVILFELLTAERPYMADDPHRVLQMHLSSPIPSPRALKPQAGISPELEGVVVRAMRKQPGDRFENAEAFDRALQQIPEAAPPRLPVARRTQPLPAVAAPSSAADARTPTPTPIPASPRPLWPLAVGATAVLALVGAAIWLWLRR
ncbi:MAG: serine/threonine protein kinase [Deltaproteobacteria bacterium]|nr:serine/threonine protein kinase [Deltaproteobacteria bacterium]